MGGSADSPRRATFDGSNTTEYLWPNKIPFRATHSLPIQQNLSRVLLATRMMIRYIIYLCTVSIVCSAWCIPKVWIETKETKETRETKGERDR